jgi:hypothetical protein
VGGFYWEGWKQRASGPRGVAELLAAPFSSYAGVWPAQKRAVLVLLYNRRGLIQSDHFSPKRRSSSIRGFESCLLRSTAQSPLRQLRTPDAWSRLSEPYGRFGSSYLGD